MSNVERNVVINADIPVFRFGYLFVYFLPKFVHFLFNLSGNTGVNYSPE